MCFFFLLSPPYSCRIGQGFLPAKTDVGRTGIALAMIMARLVPAPSLQVEMIPYPVCSPAQVLWGDRFVISIAARSSVKASHLPASSIFRDNIKITH